MYYKHYLFLPFQYILDKIKIANMDCDSSLQKNCVEYNI